MEEKDYKHIELEIEKQTIIIPYTEQTSKIALQNDILFNKTLYRIIGGGYRTLENGDKVSNFFASTPKKYNETLEAQRKLHPDFYVHDLDMILKKETWLDRLKNYFKK